FVGPNVCERSMMQALGETALFSRARETSQDNFDSAGDRSTSARRARGRSTSPKAMAGWTAAEGANDRRQSRCAVTNALRTTRSTYSLTVSDAVLGVPWVAERAWAWE